MERTPGAEKDARVKPRRLGQELTQTSGQLLLLLASAGNAGLVPSPQKGPHSPDDPFATCRSYQEHRLNWQT